LAELGFGVPWGEYRFSTWSSGIMVGFFDPASQHLGVAYSDGSAYLIDLAWLRGMGGDPSNLSAEELIAIACSGPFNYAALESSLLEDYLDGRESMACSG
jgi:hypothetical protein